MKYKLLCPNNIQGNSEETPLYTNSQFSDAIFHLNLSVQSPKKQKIRSLIQYNIWELLSFHVDIMANDNILLTRFLIKYQLETIRNRNSPGGNEFTLNTHAVLSDLLQIENHLEHDSP